MRILQNGDCFPSLLSIVYISKSVLFELLIPQVFIYWLNNCFTQGAFLIKQMSKKCPRVMISQVQKISNSDHKHPQTFFKTQSGVGTHTAEGQPWRGEYYIALNLSTHRLSLAWIQTHWVSVWVESLQIKDALCSLMQNSAFARK